LVVGEFGPERRLDRRWIVQSEIDGIEEKFERLPAPVRQIEMISDTVEVAHATSR
jgi:hypothetical protein